LRGPAPRDASMNCFIGFCLRPWKMSGPWDSAAAAERVPNASSRLGSLGARGVP
jgi:hypothetical protein